MMNKFKVFSALLFTAAFFSSCNNNHTPADILGLWVSDEESAHLFAPGASEVALLIQRDSTGSLTARGFFMNNGESRSEWEFIRAQYDSVANRISILDSDTDTLILRPDTGNEGLKGALHGHDDTREPIAFVRADRNLEIRLLHPRIPDESGNYAYSYKKPEQIQDGLKTESVCNYITDTSSISNLIKDIIDQEYGSIKSLLILKDNNLLVEEYFYGFSRNEPQQIRSCTKSVTSILLGIALDHHKKVHTSESIFTFFPDYISLKAEGREKITLEHVLTMTAGFEWDDIPAEMFEADDCFQYILSRPLETEPGEEFNYNSGCSILLGGVISYLENKDTRAFAEDSLFAPLGISDYSWEAHKDGTLLFGSGLSLRPRDMAKIGLLVLNDGLWENNQLVSKEWIRESTKPHIAESDFFDYGYQWWCRSGNTLQWWKELNTASPEEHDLITALGHGGQYIMIIRDLNLVVVTTAKDFENGGLALSKIPMVVEEIIPIFEAESL